MLVNKLRDTAKKVPDHIDFEGELSALAPADVDQAGLKELTGLDTPVAGVPEQNIFYVNQIMKFGKLLAVFQNHPTDANKTAVTAYMVLAIDESVLDGKKDFEKVPVLRKIYVAGASADGAIVITITEAIQYGTKLRNTRATKSGRSPICWPPINS